MNVLCSTVTVLYDETDVSVEGKDNYLLSISYLLYTHFMNMFFLELSFINSLPFFSFYSCTNLDIV